MRLPDFDRTCTQHQSPSSSEKRHTTYPKGFARQQGFLQKQEPMFHLPVPPLQKPEQLCQARIRQSKSLPLETAPTKIVPASRSRRPGGGLEMEITARVFASGQVTLEINSAAAPNFVSALTNSNSNHLTKHVLRLSRSQPRRPLRQAKHLTQLSSTNFWLFSGCTLPSGNTLPAPPRISTMAFVR
jgi:hypothetical protein